MKSDAFRCDIKKLYFAGSLSEWCSINFDDDDATPFYNSNNIATDTELYINNELLTSVIIPSDITKINSSAFFNCSSIKEVIIPENIIFIGKHAFNKCNSLTSVTFANPNGWHYKFEDNIERTMDVSVMADSKSAASRLKVFGHDLYK